MNKPHKHAALIKAWADGAEIQYRNSIREVWRDVSGNPAWCTMAEYRIKPKTIKYRLALVEGVRSDWVNAAMNGTEEYRIQNSSSFIKWLGDWQVVEI